MTTASKKKRAAFAVSSAAATAAIPFYMGIMDWRVLGGAAALGMIGGAFGVDVPTLIKGAAKRATKTN